MFLGVICKSGYMSSYFNFIILFSWESFIPTHFHGIKIMGVEFSNLVEVTNIDSYVCYKFRKLNLP
jgi:hypothetical protein